MSDRLPFEYPEWCSGPIVDLDIVPTGFPICDTQPAFTEPTVLADVPITMPQIIPPPMCVCIPTAPSTGRVVITADAEPALSMALVPVTRDCCDPEQILTFNLQLPCMPFDINVTGEFENLYDDGPVGIFGGISIARTECEYDIGINIGLRLPCIPQLFVTSVFSNLNTGPTGIHGYSTITGTNECDWQLALSYNAHFPCIPFELRSMSTITNNPTGPTGIYGYMTGISNLEECDFELLLTLNAHFPCIPFDIKPTSVITNLELEYLPQQLWGGLTAYQGTDCEYIIGLDLTLNSPGAGQLLAGPQSVNVKMHYMMECDPTCAWLEKWWDVMYIDQIGGQDYIFTDKEVEIKIPLLARLSNTEDDDILVEKTWVSEGNGGVFVLIDQDCPLPPPP